MERDGLSLIPKESISLGTLKTVDCLTHHPFQPHYNIGEAGKVINDIFQIFLQLRFQMLMKLYDT